MNINVESGTKMFRKTVSTLFAATGLMFCVSAAQAATIGDLTIGSKIYEESGLDITVSSSLFQASGFSIGLAFAAAPLSSGEVDRGSATATDLQIDTTDFDIEGMAHDIAIDVVADTVSILFQVTSHATLSHDDFVLAELFFSSFDIGDDTTLIDLHESTADLSIFELTPVPLPAGLPLMLVGLGGFAVMRRLKRSRTT